MNDIVSLIGTVASIGSIPLGFYFFIKSSEEKRDKIKRDIVKILLYLLNDLNLLTIFEIQSVSNSKCRESKVNIDSISTSEIIEDLISEIISNPLLTKESKQGFITNLKLLTSKDIISPKNAAEAKILPTENANNSNEKDFNFELKKAKDGFKSENLSQIFIIITSLLGIFTLLLTIGSDSFLKKGTFNELFEKNTFLWALLLGVIVSIISVIISIIIKKKKK